MEASFTEAVQILVETTNSLTEISMGVCQNSV